jgi:hypothetical protein
LTPTTERTGQARTAPEQRADRSDELTRSPIIDVAIAQVKPDGRILDQDRRKERQRCQVTPGTGRCRRPPPRSCCAPSRPGLPLGSFAFTAGTVLLTVLTATSGPWFDHLARIFADVEPLSAQEEHRSRSRSLSLVGVGGRLAVVADLDDPARVAPASRGSSLGSDAACAARRTGEGDRAGGGARAGRVGPRSAAGPTAPEMRWWEAHAVPLRPRRFGA